MDKKLENAIQERLFTVFRGIEKHRVPVMKREACFHEKGQRARKKSQENKGQIENNSR